ncbi:MAG TPA: PAS domain S-box protein, partial [Vicinamibacterales bacterium]|nr:PAS domain S-box protein [Vicinamibacterales bacterium]
IEVTARHRDGRAIAMSFNVAPIRSGNEAFAGLVIVAHDAGKKATEARAAKRLAAIVESSHDAIVSKDLNGVIVSWNAAAEQMFGYPAEEAIGRSIRMIIPDDRQTEEDEVLARIRRGSRIDHFETIRKRKDGSLFPISLTVSPILDDDGRVIGASKIARDVSDQTQLEAERARLLIEAESHAATTERLNAFGIKVASALDRSTVLQAVTDAATELIAAPFGVFVSNVVDDSGERYVIDTTSGVERDALAQCAIYRDANMFEPTFRGIGPVRSEDLITDRRFGNGMPNASAAADHLMRSYLAVPVKTRSSEVVGALVFGHPSAGHFTEQHERLATGIAAWASVALENSRLYLTLQDANRLKDEFLATLSHELRTPLNAILGYANMIKSGAVPSENQRRAIDTIERNARALAKLVEDVLDVSRIISGKMRLHAQPINLGDVVRHAVEGIVPAADAKGVHVQTTIDERLPVIRGDADRLQQIAWNLLSNAVKFTPRGGRIDVDVRSADRQIEVVVRDTGVGVSRAFLPYLFERFRQGESGIRRPGGLGLGLAISKQLTELHGGTISAESGGEGQGATFRVVFPV